MNAENRRVVRRQFGGPNGVTFVPGEIVDVSAWRWAESLEQQDVIRPFPLSVDHVTCGCGRHWRDVTAMEHHACTDTPVESAGSEDTQTDDGVVQLVPRGGDRGWFDVTVRGEIVNKHALRLGAAETFMANIELEPAAEVNDD